MVGTFDDPPRLQVAIDVAAPGERFVADAQVAPGGALGEGVELRRRASRFVDGQRRGVGADQHQRRAQRLHQVELALGPVQALREQVVGHSLEVAERLVEIDPARAEVVAHRRQLARRCRRMDEVVLEQLDRVEAFAAAIASSLARSVPLK